MKEKSDLAKIAEGRCCGGGSAYVGFKKANEAHSIGTASEIYDPIAKRTVDTLSTGETMLFWLLRYDESVVEIKEQFLLIPSRVAEAATQIGVRIPSKILTTDFLVLYDDGRLVAYSVKYSRSDFDLSTRKGRSVIRRQALEKRYWANLGVDFKIVFTDEMDRTRATNIADCMVVYDSEWVTTIDQKYRWLIAHHIVEVDMSQRIHFSEIAKSNGNAISELYEASLKR